MFYTRVRHLNKSSSKMQKMDLAKVQIKPLSGEIDWLVWKYRIQIFQNYYPGVPIYMEWQWEHGISSLKIKKNLWNELNSGLSKKNEAVLPDMLLSCKILDILQNEYHSFKSSLLLLGEEKGTIDDLSTQLCSHEREFKLSGKREQFRARNFYR